MARPSRLQQERQEVLAERNAAFHSLQEGIERGVDARLIERRRNRYRRALRAYKDYLKRAQAIGVVQHRPRSATTPSTTPGPRQHIRVRPRERSAPGTRSGGGHAVSVPLQPAPPGVAGSGQIVVEVFAGRDAGPVALFWRRTMSQAVQEVRELLEQEPRLSGADIRRRHRLVRSYARYRSSGRPRLVFRWHSRET